MENRDGLLVDLRIAEANGTAEREVALEMMDDRLPGTRRITVGGDKGYDTKDFVAECIARNVTSHVAQNISKHRGSAIDGRTTRHKGYTISQRIRKRVEEIFGWTKIVANFRRTRFKGTARTELASYFVGAAYNLLRMGRLLAATAGRAARDAARPRRARLRRARGDYATRGTPFFNILLARPNDLHLRRQRNTAAAAERR